MAHKSKFASHFYIDPKTTFLNFGSFGACSKPIFEEYQRFQMEMESDPMQFFTVTGPHYLKKAREVLAQYINCADDELVFTTNPSYATNTIGKGLRLKPGDEILSTNIEYGAADKALAYYCEKSGATYVRQPITLPITTKEKVIEEFIKGINPRTKAIFISHITSTTGLILPVKEICEIAKTKGLITMVDGAHTPGHIPLDLKNLKADIYTGACHKWMMAPKGCSFLYVKKEMQDLFDPLVISWGYNALFPGPSKFHDYHQFNGTRDYSAFLTMPVILDYMKQNNWEQIAKDCGMLVQKNARRFCELAGSVPLTPINDDFLGQMFSIPIKCEEPEKLQRHFFEKYRIQIPVMRQGEGRYLRYSIQAFNDQNDLDTLYSAVQDCLKTNTYISQ